MTVVTTNEGAALGGFETGSASHCTSGHRPSSPLGALSSYRLKRLSLKKRPRQEPLHKPLPNLHTCDSQVPIEPEAPDRDIENLAQQGPSSATGIQVSLRNAQSSTRAPGPCEGSRAGNWSQWDASEQSGPRLTEAVGMSGAFDGAPVPSAGPAGASASGRQPLQAWVPRKRNLASFDALDELSHLTSHVQRPSGGQGRQLPALSKAAPTQRDLAGPPHRAPAWLPGAQEPALQRVHVSGANALGRRLHSRPFAAPRPMQKPEAEACAPDRPLASALASAACGSDAAQLLEGDPGATLHEHRLHPGKSADNIHSASGKPGDAWDTDGVVSDSETSESSSAALGSQPSGDACANVTSMVGPSAISPVTVPSHNAHSSRDPQQAAPPHQGTAVGRGCADDQCAQLLPSAASPSYSFAKIASPISAAAARVAAPQGKTTQAAGRKKLKRLYSSDNAHLPPHMAAPTQSAEGEDADVVADLGLSCRQSPSRADARDKDNESVSEGTDSLGALNAPAPQLKGPGRSLKRLRRICDMSPEAAVRVSFSPGSRGKPHDEYAYPKPAAQGAPRANPFISAKASIAQEPKLACHAAPAQPQYNTLGDDLSCGDMHDLLRGHRGQQQARAKTRMDAEPEAAAGGVIDLASEDSSGGGEGFPDPPARPKHRRICLPGMPSPSAHRLSQGRQTNNRSYLGAYSSADIMPEPAQLDRAQAPVPEQSSTQNEPSLNRGWQQRGQHEEECGRCEGPSGAVPQVSFSLHPPATHQHGLLGAQQCRAQCGVGTGIPAKEAARPGVFAERSDAARQPRQGGPWWHRLYDFVPVAAICDGRDPRDGSRVLIDYRAQFSGEKHATAAGGGFQQAKRGRKAQRGAAAARVTETTREEGSCVGHWLTTHQHGRLRKVYVAAGGRKQLTGAAAHAAYERDKRAAGSFAKDT